MNEAVYNVALYLGRIRGAPQVDPFEERLKRGQEIYQRYMASQAEIARLNSIIAVQKATLDHQQKWPSISGGKVRLSTILETVARYYEVPLDALTGESRMHEVIIPRHVACYLAQRRGYSTPQIARALNRDHTTVIAARRNIERLRTADATLDAEVNQIELMIGGKPTVVADVTD